VVVIIADLTAAATAAAMGGSGRDVSRSQSQRGCL
jgi:hypothetical protein